MGKKRRTKVRDSVKNRIRVRAGDRCEKCMTDILFTSLGLHNGSFHHRHVWRLGGRNQTSNLVLLCSDCHKAIHQDEAEAARFGWIAWFDAEMTPVLLHGVEWVLLVPDGSFESLDPSEAVTLMWHTNATGPREGVAEPS